MGDTYYIPKIEVSKKQINICQDTDKRELLFARNKTSNGESPLFFKKGDGIDKSKLVATMSYKKIGQKLAKKISLVSGSDFFYKYDKKTGYFDKQRSLISPSGNEYSIYSMSMKKFYSELIDILKVRLTLGFIESDDKTQSAEYYFRNAHKYILMRKYNFNIEECINFVNTVVARSYIPEEFYEGFLAEFRKSFYDGEFSKGEILERETEAKLSLMNEKNGKVAFDDMNLYTKIINDMSIEKNERKMNMIRLREEMFKHH